jgi:hypothetical protein
MLFQGIPLLKKKELPSDFQACSDQNLLYAGKFYRRLREPQVLIDVIEKAIALDPSIVLNIYTKDDALDSVDRRIHSDHIYTHGYVDQNTLDRITAESTALVSLGNRTTEMFPSKIISYLASLKPIIHIYQSSNDPVIPFLKNYPNALLLNGMDDPAINAQQLVAFLREDHDEITMEEVLDQFSRYTGSCCAEEIRSFLKHRGFMI